MRIERADHCSAKGWAVFGGYWPRGTVRTDRFSLTGEGGGAVPVQSEVTARWPDGSVKWSRHAAAADGIGAAGELAPGDPAPSGGFRVEEAPDAWRVAGTCLSVTVPKRGGRIASDCRSGGQGAFSSVTPVLQICHVHESGGGRTLQVRSLPAEIRSRVLESAGPLETVFRFDGVFREEGQEKMPFRIRMYLRENGEIAFDDTFFFQGDPEKDRLAGWGLRFETRLRGRPYQRHIRFLTDGAVFHDHPTQLFYWRKHLDPALLAAQQRGETVPAGEELDAVSGDLPRWDRFALVQDSAFHFCIRKKAHDRGCWLDGVHGRRAPGSMALSDPERTLSFHLRECWEKHPAGLEAENLSGDTSACTVWFYSPQAQPFDFRHYDRRTYPMGNYEGFDYMLPDPNGIAVTCRVSVFPDHGYTPDEQLQALSDQVRTPPVYLASPEYYHAHRAFGYWSLPDRTTEVGQWMENQLDSAFDFYEAEVEARSWYGLFDYGDFMHTYEPSRHMWRWDTGGYAWDNTELVPTYWLWLQFLRTGSGRVLRLAEALSRHAADVDMYHFGPMKGLGSRHNVRHWGCPCKEPRVSMAGHHRPLYYLLGDRRIGDCMEDSLAAAESLGAMPWFRTGDGGVRLRTGPDWAALLSGWMTACERTSDPAWRQKIEAGIVSLARAPLGLTSGPEFRFDPSSGRLDYCGEMQGSMHLQACMGEPEIWLETADMLGSAALAEMTARNGLYFYLSEEERLEKSGGLLRGRTFGSPVYSAEMQAWAARESGNAAMARRIWARLLALLWSEEKPEGFLPVPYHRNQDGSLLSEIPWITTNFTAQWCLKAIVTAEFIPESRPGTLAELGEWLRKDPPPDRMYGA